LAKTTTLIGYVCCSTDKQDLAAQKATLEKLGVAAERIYTVNQPGILRPRENPNTGLRVDHDLSGVSEVRSFRVLTWTEYSRPRGNPGIQDVTALISVRPQR